MITSILAFAGVAAVVNVTPGLDTMMVLRTSISGGRMAGFASGLGVNTGCLVWGVMAAAGVTELLVASHLAYEAVRVAGAVYLIWLGCCALWRSRRGRRDAGAERAAADVAPGRLAAFRSGLGTNLLNPKAGIFYMSLLPQFIPQGRRYSVRRCC